ncbi:MAG: kelch repeat-containing protein [Acidobacteriota bacterium]
MRPPVSFLGVALHAFIGIAACSSAGAQQMAWVQKSPSTSPAARHRHAMAYHMARAQAVLFGGIGDSGVLGDTWTWNGSAWSQAVPSSSPPARMHHAMAYDAARGQVVLYGGMGAFAFGDTWVWDGTTWHLKAPFPNPSFRSYHAMAYDSSHAEVILFGGYEWTRMNDTWGWDGTSWTVKTPATSPSARTFHAMAYDAARSELVLFGGWDGASPLGDTWVWNGSDWTRRYPLTSPPARDSHAMAYDAARGQVVLFGGWNRVTDFNDTWTWDGTTWTQQTPSAMPSLPLALPPARSFHAMTYDVLHQEVVLFGGSNPDALLSDTWVWRPWSGPLISSIKSKSSRPGTSATITGSGFSATKTANTVKFGKYTSSVTKARTTQLTVTIPTKCKSGKTYRVQVTVSGNKSNVVQFLIK